MTTTNTPELLDIDSSNLDAQTPHEGLAVAPAPQGAKPGIAAVAGKFMLMVGALLVATDAGAQQGDRGRGGRQSGAAQQQTNQQRGSAAEKQWNYTIEQINGHTYAVYTGMTVNDFLVLKQSRNNLPPQAQTIVDKAIMVTSRDGQQHPAFQVSGQTPPANPLAGQKAPGLNAAAPTLNVAKQRKDESLADAKQGVHVHQQTDLSDLKSLGIKCYQTISAELDEAEQKNPKDVRTIRAAYAQLLKTKDLEEAKFLYGLLHPLLTHSPVVNSSGSRKASRLDANELANVAARVRVSVNLSRD